MALTRQTWNVDLAPLDDDGKPDFAAEVIELRDVMVTQGDRVVAELEANKLKLPNQKVAAITASTMWIWAALKRTGEVSDKWVTFRDRCVAVALVKEAPVDPSPPATPSASG